MAFAQDGPFIAAENATDFSTTGQYRAVKRDTDGKFVLCEAADAEFEGIMQDDLPAGQHGTAKTRDTSKAVAGAAVTRAGIDLTTDDDARLVAATTGDPVVARSQSAAAAAGDLFSVRIDRAGVVA